MRRCLILACAVVLLPALARADEVFLKSGGRLSGRILSQTATSIAVDVGPGTITVPMSSVLRIEERRSTLHEYQDRADRLLSGDVSGWLALAAWAGSQGLNTQARQAYQQVIAADPPNVDANTALGRVWLDGRWVSEAESYRLRGYVPFDGGWVTAAEYDAIQQRRAAEYEAEMDAMRQVREAEARAAEAEARAREAEARSQSLAVPLWWGGWWGGSVVAPSPKARWHSGYRETQRPPIGIWPAPSVGVSPSQQHVWPSSSLGVWPSSSLGVWPSQSLGVWPSQPLAVWPSPSVGPPRAQPAPAPHSGGAPGRGHGGGVRRPR